MGGTRIALFVHLVWSTWDRLPLLVGDVERRVHRCIEDTCREQQVEVLALGGVEDHVHLLVRLPATLAVADLMQRIKGASSHLATHEVAPDHFFKWQGGYAAFSVGHTGLPAARAYIAGQKERHRLGSLIAACEPDLPPSHNAPSG
jgi:putative transposase